MASPSSSGLPIRKRLYQPSVSNYFAKLSESSGNAAVSPPTHQTIAPQLPSAVQSSLLNVGMRVRKAVPEGYKNISVEQSHSTFAAAIPEYEKENQLHYQPRESTSSGFHNSSRAELMPFSGMHKIGGLSFQESSYRSPHPAPIFDAADVQFDSYFPSSSQESNVSSISTDSMPALRRRQSAHSKKRQFADDESYGDTDDFIGGPERIDPSYPVFTIFADGTAETVEERLAAEDTAMLDQRRIARPVTRKRTSNTQPQLQVQSQMGMAGATCDDFEDASFLRPKELEMEDI